MGEMQPAPRIRGVKPGRRHRKRPPPKSATTASIQNCRAAERWVKESLYSECRKRSPWNHAHRAPVCQGGQKERSFGPRCCYTTSGPKLRDPWLKPWLGRIWFRPPLKPLYVGVAVGRAVFLLVVLLVVILGRPEFAR